MLIWVASYPRSGNHLVMLTLRNAYGVGSLGVAPEEDLGLGRLPKLPGASTPWRPPPELSGLPRNDLLEALRERPEPFFIRTHRLSEVPDPAPALYLVRDGRDALVSQAWRIEAPRFRELPFNRRLATLIAPGVPAYGHWSRNIRRWRSRKAPIAMIRFEELIRDPVGTVGTACERLDLGLGSPVGEVPSFEYSQKQMPNIFRRGVEGSHRDEMIPRLQERFWRVHRREMEALDYYET